MEGGFSQLRTAVLRVIRWGQEQQDRFLTAGSLQLSWRRNHKAFHKQGKSVSSRVIRRDDTELTYVEQTIQK